ncbi:MAG: hypothetical protein RBT73_02575 [Spirochaetia bacterium]|jgi:hypothetical protein|nr:hypothetical protein [Spirochaetia bacterium]
MGSKPSTKQVGKEYTDAGVSALTNEANFGKAGMEGAIAGMSPVTAGNVGFDPNAYWGNFMGQAGDLQGLVMGPQGDLQRGLTARAGELATQATQGAASNLSGLGSLYSGATLKAAGNANAQAFGDVANTLGQQSLNLYGNLAGQAMGNSLGAQGQGLSAMQGNQNADLQAQMANQQNSLGLAGLYGGLYGQGVGGLAQYGTPTYVQGQSGGIGSMFSGALGGALAGGSIPGAGWAGAGVGGALGGLGGLFG